jgi:hypothetical protein
MFLFQLLNAVSCFIVLLWQRRKRWRRDGWEEGGWQTSQLFARRTMLKSDHWDAEGVVVEIRFTVRRVFAAFVRKCLVSGRRQQGNEWQEFVDSCIRLQYSATLTRLLAERRGDQLPPAARNCSPLQKKSMFVLGPNQSPIQNVPTALSPKNERPGCGSWAPTSI